MDFQQPAAKRNGNEVQITLSGMPDQCPRCHKSINVKPMETVLLVDGYAQSVYRCSSQLCDELFLANYQRYSKTGHYNLVSTAPINFLPQIFPETVTKISSSFVEIYNQALAAEAQRLGQLVGIGLRKSLEFLIKDFLSSQHPDDEAEIKKTQLGPCIDKWVADVNIKSCAKRAAWLGNDETHYVRKWEDKDISDLKVLVKLTSNWIDNSLLTKEYIDGMPPNK